METLWPLQQSIFSANLVEGGRWDNRWRSRAA
jgi:hypothetical protein